MFKKSTFSFIFFPWLIFIVSSLFVLLGIVNHWFGEPREGIMKFCEFARDGYIKQPSNTFSNLGFSIVGLYIVYYFAKNKLNFSNLFTQNYSYVILFSSSIIITGAGSFAMHATNAHWGGFFDLLGMFFIASFMLSYALKRLLHFSHSFFVVLFLSAVLVSSYIYLTPSINQTGHLFTGAELIFMLMLFTAICIECYFNFIKKISIHKQFGLTSIFLLIISFGIWTISLSKESIFCEPHSYIQGHAIWHILDAIACLYLFKYYLSEKTV